MSQSGWRLLDRKFSGTTLLVTGAVGLTFGWVSAALWQYSTASEEATPTEQDNQEDNESLAEAESNYSEPTTPRSFGQPRQTPRRTNTGLKFDATASATAEYKQVILIRTDLDMGTGKAAAQACHASVSAVKKAWRQKDPAYKAWEANSAVKICLGIDSAQALMSIKEQARDAGLVTAMIIDSGSPSRDRTILAVGPGLTAKIDAITRQLKLFDEA